MATLCLSMAASPPASDPPTALVVMGVSGSGKTTLGLALSRALDWRFVDGDDLHPPENVAKMASGTPLTDDDRWPWLDRVAATLAAPESTIVACSALRRIYRDRIRAGAGTGVAILHLDAPKPALEPRMNRPGHYMPPALLDSQLATLEPPDPDEGIATLDATLPPDTLLRAARLALGL